MRRSSFVVTNVSCASTHVVTARRPGDPRRTFPSPATYTLLTAAASNRPTGTRGRPDQVMAPRRRWRGRAAGPTQSAGGRYGRDVNGDSGGQRQRHGGGRRPAGPRPRDGRFDEDRQADPQAARPGVRARPPGRGDAGRVRRRVRADQQAGAGGDGGGAAPVRQPPVARRVVPRPNQAAGRRRRRVHAGTVRRRRRRADVRRRPRGGREGVGFAPLPCAVQNGRGCGLPSRRRSTRISAATRRPGRASSSGWSSPPRRGGGRLSTCGCSILTPTP